MKIIIVDDESNALHIFLDEIIARKDIDYKFFTDKPEDILDYIAAQKVDAAFLDIRMPSVDGTVLAKQIIDVCPDIKIVFITGLDISYGDLPQEIKGNTIGFIYKPYDKEVLANYLNIISDESIHLDIKTFDTFECYLNGRPLEFTSGKSKELFALLVVYNGKTLTITDAIAHLWADHDPDKAKILYRDAVWRLRKTLQKVNFDCITSSYGEIALKKENISCDFWDYCEGKKSGYNGEFLKNYDWSLEYLPELDKINKS